MMTGGGAPARLPAGGFVVRVIVGALYAVTMVAGLWLGPIATGMMLSVFAGLAAGEFYAMERREAKLPNELIGVVAAASMPLSAALWGLQGLSAVVTALIAAALVWHVGFGRVRLADTTTTVFGAIYCGFTLGYLVLVRRFDTDLVQAFDLDSGLVLSLALVAGVWANDSLAYIAGSLFGRHKMAPRISPKKSWEGFFAGLLGTLAVWTVIPQLPGVTLPLKWALLAGVGIAFGTIIGDLAESRIKREAGVKDSGRALPGHGGFLDRMDSLILASLIAYWILWWGGVR